MPAQWQFTNFLLFNSTREKFAYKVDRLFEFMNEMQNI